MEGGEEMKIQIGEREWDLEGHEIHGINSQAGAEIFQAVADLLEEMRTADECQLAGIESLGVRVEALERQVNVEDGE